MIKTTSGTFFLAFSVTFVMSVVVGVISEPNALSSTQFQKQDHKSAFSAIDN